MVDEVVAREMVVAEVVMDLVMAAREMVEAEEGLKVMAAVKVLCICVCHIGQYRLLQIQVDIGILDMAFLLSV